MKKIQNTTLITGLLLLAGFYSASLSAGMSNDTHWLIQPGDSLYKIARNIFPGDTKKQAQLRKALINHNPQAFKNGAANISVGDKLQLPEFAVKKKKPAPPVIAKKPKAILKTIPVEKPEPAKVVTPDPEDVIGQVVINVGQLSAENRGAIRNLNRRSSIFHGDTISTGSNSHTQIRLKDGALLSLRPYTDIKIAEYRYNGQQDGSEQSLIELLKGGFRTITGAIGHRNKQNYRVRTSVATIGIRGTHYTLMLCQQQSCRDDNANQVDDGLYGGVADGSILIENESGIHRFNNDQFFHVTSARTPPIERLIPPAILKSGPEKIAGKDNKARKKVESTISQQVQAQHRRLPVIFEPNQPTFRQRPPLPVADLNTNTVPMGDLTPKKAPDGSAMLIGFLHTDNTGDIVGAAAPIVVTSNNTNEIFLGSITTPDGKVVDRIPVGALESSFSQEFQRIVEHELFMASPTGVKARLVPSSLGGNAALGVNWGRWNGEFTVLEDGKRMNTQEDFHFIYSENLTSPTQIANLGSLNAFISYGLDTVAGNGTLPTDQLGNVGSVNFITMNADFAARVVTSYDVSVTVNNNNYQASAVDIPFTNLNQGFNIQSISAGCPSGGICTGEASLIFVGNNAQGALNSYHIDDSNGTSSVTGTALLTEAPQ